MRGIRATLLIFALFATCKGVAFAQNRKAAGPAQSFTDAAMQGDLSAVKAFLDQGVDINIAPQGFEGWTPLMAATTFGQAEIVRFLLDHQAKTGVALKDGSTLLYQAAQNGNKDVADYLIHAGVGLNTRTNEGRTALIRAAWMGHGDVVRLLLAAGADVTIADKDGWTAFHFACSSGDLTSIQAFLSRGADINERDGKGETPLMWATGNRNNDVFRALLDAGAKVNERDGSGKTPLMFAASYLDVIKIKMLVSAGANMSDVDSKGWTALMYAASNAKWNGGCGNDDMAPRVIGAKLVAESLISAGSGVNAQSTLGETALILAVKSGHVEFVRSLIMSGADTRLRTAKGETALTVASKLSRTQRQEILRILRYSGDQSRSRRHFNERPRICSEARPSQLWRPFQTSICDLRA